MKTSPSSFFALHCISTQLNAMHLTHGFIKGKPGEEFVEVCGRSDEWDLDEEEGRKVTAAPTSYTHLGAQRLPPLGMAPAHQQQRHHPRSRLRGSGQAGLEDSMICSCGCVLVLVIDTDEDGGCCDRALKTVCPRCLSLTVGAGTTNTPHPFPSHETEEPHHADQNHQALDRSDRHQASIDPSASSARRQ